MAGRGSSGGGYAIGRRGRWPGGFMQEGAEGRRFRRVYARGCRSAPSQGCCEAGLRRCGRRGAAVPGSYARGRRGVVARRVAAVPVCPPFRDRSRGGREVGAVPPVAGDCRERGCAAVDSGVRRFRGGYAIGRRGRRPGGFMQEGAGARRPKVVVKRGCTAVDGGARQFRGGVCDRTARGGGPAGYARGRRGVVARRVAAVPVCPPFRDRSRGGREAGAAPPVAGGCCEAGLHRCGWRGAAVPGGYARGRRGGGGSGELCERAQRGGGPAGGCRAGLSAIS